MARPNLYYCWFNPFSSDEWPPHGKLINAVDHRTAAELFFHDALRGDYEKFRLMNHIYVVDYYGQEFRLISLDSKPVEFDTVVLHDIPWFPEKVDAQ